MGCSVQYRSQVETDGRSANYQYAPGAFLRYDGYNNVAGDLEGAVIRFRASSGRGEVLLIGMPRLIDSKTVGEIETLFGEVDIAFHLGTASGAEKRKTEDILFEMVGSLLGLDSRTGLESRSDLPWRDCLEDEREGEVPADLHESMGRISRAIEQMQAIGKPMLARFPVERFQDFLKHQYARSLVHSNGSPIEGLRQFISRVRTLMQGAIQSWPRPKFLEIERLLEGIEQDLAHFGVSRKIESAVAIARVIVDTINDSSRPQSLGVFVDVATASALSKLLIEEGFESEVFHWIDIWRLDARMVEGKR
jgi:hypothetical protein